MFGLRGTLSVALLLGATCFPFTSAYADISTLDLDDDKALLQGAQRNDMDAHFSYAKKAMKERNAREAEWALRQMLEKNPSLDRVKLELGLVLIPQGKLAEAKQLFEEVKGNNPPAPVIKNIDAMLALLEKGMKPHQLGGSFTAGFNMDSNANSAPASGDITVLDTSIPLGAGAGTQDDGHFFGALSLSHVYRHDINPKVSTLRWKTDVLEYRTKQGDLTNLDLVMHSVRSGPEITLLDSGAKFGLFASYSMIDLNYYSYLNTPKGEYMVDLPLTTALAMTFSGSYEYREYQNAPGITTYEDRKGQGLQQNFGLRYTASENWLLDAGFFVRDEDAKKEYFNNQQVGVTAGATYLFSPETFANVKTGFRQFDYEAADPLISTKIREDEETSIGFTIGRSFAIPETEQRMTLTAGYQFKDVHSTIQNYDYNNHRISTSLNLAF